MTANERMRDAAAKPGDTPRTLRWQRAMYWPLTIAALLFLVTYTFHVVGDVSGTTRVVTTVLLWLSRGFFVFDYLVRLGMAKPRGAWMRSHLFDLAVILIPALRPVRLLDAMTRLRAFSGTRGSRLRASLVIYSVGSAFLLVWYFSLSVLAVERNAPGASITSFGDAVWWAFCTLTTVGYGDYTPVTVWGRVLAVALMLSGVVLVGVTVAVFSSFVNDRVSHPRPPAS